MLPDLSQSQGSQSIVTISISSANIACQASDNSGMMLQESMIAFQRPRQRTIILRAINALQQSSLSKDKLQEPTVNQLMQPKGLQPIVDGPSLVAKVGTCTRLPCNANARQTTQEEAVCFSLFPRY